MKCPPKPPDLIGLQDALLANGRAVKVLGAELPEGYPHWDKVRYLPPPGDLTPEEWWLAIKFARSSNRKFLTLRDELGSAFNYHLPEYQFETLHRIDLGMGGNIGVPEPIANHQTRDQYYIKSLIHESITSSQLEGAVTTREVAKEMIRTGRPPVDKSERMILNNYKTMRRISRLKDRELDMGLLLDVHREITVNTLDEPDAVGRLRKPTEKVCVYDDEDDQILHSPPPAEDLNGRLKLLFDYANAGEEKPFVHPVVRAIIVHFWLAYEHPFVDGNGRTARALFYWCLLHYGYWLFEFVSISGILLNSPKKYARAFLYTESDENDLTYFIAYQLDVIDRAVRGLHEYIDRKGAETRNLEIRLRRMASLNHRQRALMVHALKHPYQLYTVKSHQGSHGITPQTSRTDLQGLERLGFLRLESAGKPLVYGVPQNLVSKLER